MSNAPVAAGGNWRYLKAHRPTGGGLYLVQLQVLGETIYNVARWDGVHWDMFSEQITHWAPLYSPSGEPQND